MITFSRTDTSTLGRWWWTVDRWLLVAIGVLIAVGTVLTLAASPAVAVRIGLPSFHFVERQIAFLVPAVLIMIAVSLLDPVSIRRLAVITFAGAMLGVRSEEHTSELQSLMRNSYAVFCLNKKKNQNQKHTTRLQYQLTATMKM